MKFIDIKDVVQRNDWEFLFKTFLPVTVAVSFSFDQCMHIVGNLLNTSAKWNTDEEAMTSEFMRDYVVNLMIILREKHPDEWQKDWKNEAFLGMTCGLVFREEEAFKYIKNAYQQHEDPPQSLILVYIRAGGPPNYFLSRKEIVSLAQKALDKGITYESALQMAHLAATDDERAYWEKRADEAGAKKVHTAVITPKALKNIFKERGEYRNEE
jgi:hypothetical protein